MCPAQFPHTFRTEGKKNEGSLVLGPLWTSTHLASLRTKTHQTQGFLWQITR